MKTNPFATFLAFWLSLVLLCLSLPLRADQFGLFTYQVVGGATVEITGYPQDAVGPVGIPATIDGKPVTSIAYEAFYGCSGITSVTIPFTVTDIGIEAFGNSTALKSIIVELENPQYTSVEGVLFNATQTTLIRYPGGKPGVYTIPSGVTSIDSYAFSGSSGLNSVTLPDSVTTIGQGAFLGCSGLTSVTIPASVATIGDGAFLDCSGLTSVTILEGVTTIGPEAFAYCGGLTSLTIPPGVTTIGDFAFQNCSRLAAAVLVGDAPSIGLSAFESAALKFTIYYLSGRAGFTSPTWEGYPSTMIDEAPGPAGTWLLALGLWYDTDLHQDPDGDGVDLLMAYALDLDPRLNPRGSLPEPMLNGNTLSLSFHATSPGITYKIETSTDFENWTTQGVTQSASGPDGRSIASVPRDSLNRFLRLVVHD